MQPSTSWAEDAAERIIRVEGLTFALACSVGKDTELREARELLKAAIVRELVAAKSSGSAYAAFVDGLPE